MIPVTQTKVVVKNSKGEEIVRGNCYAAAVASFLDLPIGEVPNVETFFHMEGGYWQDVMLTFLNSKGWDLCSDDRFRVFHDGTFGLEQGKRAEWLHDLRNKYYLVTGRSLRGFAHICIYKRGKLFHDPHPSRDGLVTEEYFQSLEKVEQCPIELPTVQVS
jgi:hypothetical protein